jgi:hypothetical protein
MALNLKLGQRISIPHPDGRKFPFTVVKKEDGKHTVNGSPLFGDMVLEDMDIGDLDAALREKGLDVDASTGAPEQAGEVEVNFDELHAPPQPATNATTQPAQTQPVTK